MNWSVAELQIRDKIQEASASYWTSARLMRDANLRMNEIALIMPDALMHDYLVKWTEDVQSNSTATDDYQKFALTTTIIKMHAVRYACGPSFKPEPCKIYTNMAEFLAKIEERSERELAMHPIAIVWHGRLYVAPRAIDYDGGGYTVTNGLEMLVQREPSELTGNSSTIELPDMGIKMLIDSVIADCWSKAGEEQKASFYLPTGMKPYQVIVKKYGG